MRRSHDRKRVKTKAIVSSDMDPIKLPTRPASRFGFQACRNNPKRSNSSLTLTSFALVATVMSLLICCYLFLSGENPREPLKYGVIIDGGSSGTRIHVFRFRIDGGKVVLDLGEDGHSSMKVNPGLSAYSEDPDGAIGSIKQLLELAKAKIPREMWGDSEIRLMATAGLRLLEASVQERILMVCRRVLRSSGFKFKDEWASVISGRDEGVYAWVVANYALGTLGGDPLATSGIIELGGASAQITFASIEPVPPEFSHSITFENFTYNLYSHSFLHFGQDFAFDSLRQLLISGDLYSASESLQKGMSIDPCSPKGYAHDMTSLKVSSPLMTENGKYLSSLQAGGNFTECRSAALTLLQKGNGSIFTPELRGKFLATENFFHTSKFFGFGQKALLSDFMMAGEQFCGEEWSMIKTKHPSLTEEELIRYCFSSAYIVALLHDRLGISLDDERIMFTNEVEGVPLDWALGAFILQNTADLGSHGANWIDTIISDDSPTLLYLIGFSITLTLITLCVSRWRRPQFKTVFDLEKGRYIITRAK